MSIPGVSFQPGFTGSGNSARAVGNQDGVQEAIKVLSLRMPRVVGAQGIAAAPLLQSQGSGGSRVDSVVSSILARLFPTGQQETSMPSFGTAPASEPAPYQMPNFSGSHSGPQAQTSYAAPQTRNPWVPRIVAAGGPPSKPPQAAAPSPFPSLSGSEGDWQPPTPSAPTFDTAPPERYEPPSI